MELNLKEKQKLTKVSVNTRSQGWYEAVCEGRYLPRCIKCLKKENIIMQEMRKSTKPKSVNIEISSKKGKFF